MVFVSSDQVQAVRRVLDEAFADKKFATPSSKAQHGAKMDDLVDKVIYLMATEPDPYDRSHGLIRLIRHLRLDKVPQDYQARIAALWRDHPMLSARSSPMQTLKTLLPQWDKQIKDFHARTDMGLSLRLIDQFGTDISRSPELGYFGWRHGRWVNAEEKIVLDPCVKEMIRRLASEVDYARALGEAWAAEAAEATKKAGESTGEEKALAEARAKEAQAEADKAPDEAAAAFKFAKNSQSGKIVNAVRSLAISEGGFTVDGTAWDSDPALLGTPGGTLELGDMVTLRPARRIDRITKLTAVPYDRSNQDGDRWESFLAEALPDEAVRHYFQKLCGYSLYGANPERLLVFLIGPTSTGKSTVLAAIAKVLGDHAGSFEMSMFRGKEQEAPRPDLIAALPKRFLHTSEAAERWVLHADEIKRALGGADHMRARKMRKDEYLSRRPAFLPFVATNAAPTIKGADTALWRRLTVVPFEQQVDREAEQRDLADQLADEHGEAILAWLVDGWEMYKAEGLTNVPHACVTATMELTTSLEPIDVWLAEATEADPEHVITVDDLWISYLDWCGKSGIKDDEKGNKIGLGKALSGRGYAVTKTGPKNKRVNARRGLQLIAVSAQS